MTTTVIDRIDEEQAKTRETKAAAKKVLLDEVLLHHKLIEKGVRYNAEELLPFQDPLRLNEDGARESAGSRSGGFGGFYLPHGVSASSHYNHYTPYRLVVEDNKPVLYEEANRIGEIKFHRHEPWIEERLPSGEKFRDVASVTLEGQFGVGYSNECSLADNGDACYFCSKAKVGTYTGKPFLKTPRQIADAYAIARRNGNGNQFKITGGFIPERRELEYYIDVFDLVATQHKNNFFDAVIGCPADLKVLDKYKEAGTKTIDLHIEIWDKNIFAALNPGKNKIGSGWQHWVDATLYAVELFGKGNVHSKIVAGLEPKQSVLEGVEFFASKGVVMKVGVFRPVDGTPLEGFVTPTAEWHNDLVQKVAAIWHKYGFTSANIHAGSHPGRPVSDVYEILAGNFEGDYLPQWKYPPLGD